jgi:hypothetical protein
MLQGKLITKDVGKYKFNTFTVGGFKTSDQSSYLLNQKTRLIQTHSDPFRFTMAMTALFDTPTVRNIPFSTQPVKKTLD